MKERIYETRIIGGGISGLSCARKLQDEGRDFLLISKELGGRMMTSRSLNMDYGAAYMTEDYKNLVNPGRLILSTQLRKLHLVMKIK